MLYLKKSVVFLAYPLLASVALVGISLLFIVGWPMTLVHKGKTK